MMFLNTPKKVLDHPGEDTQEGGKMQRKYSILFFALFFFLFLLQVCVSLAEDLETGKDRRTDGVSLSFETATEYANLFTGSSSYSIPIELPAGPGGFTPSLALVYSSDNGNGWTGIGWAIAGLDRIERSKKYGIPLYFDAIFGGSQQNFDHFDLYLHGSHYELFLDFATLQYVTNPYAHFKIDYIEPASSGISEWKIVDKSGVEYTFRGIPAVGRSGYRYYPITQAVDRNANLIKYDYADRNGNPIKFGYVIESSMDCPNCEYYRNGDYYPNKITYGLSTRPIESIDATYLTVEFRLEDRKDPLANKIEEVSDYKGGSRMVMNKRIRSITVKRVRNSSLTSTSKDNFCDDSSGQIPQGEIRRYCLKYSATTRGRQSLLSEVRLKGLGSDYLGYKFTYQGQSDKEEGFKEVIHQSDGSKSTGGIPDLWPLKSRRGPGEDYPGVRWVDVNGDALADMVWGLDNRNDVWKDHNRVGAKALAQNPLSWTSIDDSIQFYDLPLDQVKHDAKGFPAPIAVFDSHDKGVFAGTELIDVDGDGFIDIIHSFEDYNGSVHKLVWINKSGAGWELDPAWSFPEVFATYIPLGDKGAAFKINDIKIVDVNGDSFPDIVSAKKGAFLNKAAYGQKGWESKPNPLWKTPIDSFGDFGVYLGDQIAHYVDYGVRYVDLNGDGLNDIIVYRNPRCTWEELANPPFTCTKMMVHEVWINTGHAQIDGTAYVKDEKWRLNNLYDMGLFTLGENIWGSNLGTQIIDINMDGLPDLVYSMKISDSSTSKAVLFNTGNGWGNPVKASKTPSGAKYNTWVDELPEFAVQVPGVTATMYEDNGVSFADFNGDGAPDIGQSRYNYKSKTEDGDPELFMFVEREIGVWYNKFKPALLSKVETPYGGTIEYQYIASHQDGGQNNHRDTNGINRMPFPKQVVSSITIDDGIRNRVETQFEYRAGVFDFAHREFRGFRTVTMLPGGSGSKDLKTRQITYTFFQDDARKGRIASIRDGSTKVFSETFNIYVTFEAGKDPRGKSYETLLESTYFLNYDYVESGKDLLYHLNFDVANAADKNFSYGPCDNLTYNPWKGGESPKGQCLGGPSEKDDFERIPCPAALIPLCYKKKELLTQPFGGYTFNGLVKIPLFGYTFPALSIQTWVRPDPDYPQSDQAVVIFYSAFSLYVDRDYYLIGEIDHRGLIKSSVPIPPDEFTHVAFTYDGKSTARLHINGKLVAESFDFTGPIDKGYSLQIGCGPTCSVDEMKIFKNVVRVPKISKVTYAYGPYANIADIYFYGDLGDPKDDFVVHTDYIHDKTRHVMDIPSYTYIREPGYYTSQKIKSAAWYYYDDNYNLTKEEYWGGIRDASGEPKSGEKSNPVTSYQYDIYGNITQIQDALNRTTTFTYDPSFPVFPVTIQNAMGHTAAIDYYGAGINEQYFENYLGQFGQIKRITDPNGSATRFVYDRYGRIRAIYGPNDGDIAQGHLYPSILYSYGRYELQGRQFINLDILARNEHLLENVKQHGPTTIASFDSNFRKGWQTSINTFTRWNTLKGVGSFDENYVSGGGALPFYPQTPGASYVSSSFVYFDGFGRPLESIMEAEGKDMATIGGIVTYDLLGRPKELHKSYSLMNKYLYLSPSGWVRNLSLDAPYQDPDLNQPGVITEYDEVGRTVKITGPDGAMTTYEYDQSRVTVIDPNGHKKTYHTDAYGRLVKVEEFKGVFGEQATQQPVEIAVPNFDPSNPPFKGGTPEGAPEANGSQPGDLEFLFPGQVVTFMTSYVTEYKYDILGNLITIKDPGGNEINFEYDTLGRRTKMIDPDIGGKPSKYADVPSVIYPGKSWNYTYDLVGNLVEIADAKGQRVGFEYDALDRPVKKRQYDVNLWTAGSVSAAIAFLTGHDDLVSATGLWHPSKYRTDYITTASYAFNHEDTHSYEDSQPVSGDLVVGPVDLREFISWFDSPKLSFSYYWDTRSSIGMPTDLMSVSVSADGNSWDVLLSDAVIKSHHPAGQWGTMHDISLIQYAGGKVWVKFSINTMTAPASTSKKHEGWYINLVKIEGLRKTDVETPTTWEYDNTRIGGLYAIGRLVKMTDPSGSTEYSYDNEGQVTKIAKAIDGKSYLASFDYDAMGRIKSVTYPDNEHVEYKYGRDGYMKSATIAGSLSIIKDAQYDAVGNVRKLAFGNAMESHYSYDDTTTGNQLLSKILTVRIHPGGFFMMKHALQNLGYKYDLKGNISERNDLSDSKNSYEYYYDEFDRLTKAVNAGSNHEYRYDSLGNMIGMENDIHEYEKTGFAGPHAVTKIKPSSAKSNQPDMTFQYDANGNRIEAIDSKGIKTTYSYDYENHLTGINKDVSITYDGNGIRAKKREGEKNSTLYPFPFYEVVNGSPVKYYFFNGTMVAMQKTLQKLPKKTLEGDPQRSRDPNDLLFFHADNLGSLNHMTNAEGEDVGMIEYDPYGGIRAEKGSTLLSKYKFTGKELDSSGLYYFGARYYDPKTGEFVTPDPLDAHVREIGMGNSQSLNLYSYVLNNPVNLVDPFGLQACGDDPYCTEVHGQRFPTEYIPGKWGMEFTLPDRTSEPKVLYDLGEGVFRHIPKENVDLIEKYRNQPGYYITGAGLICKSGESCSVVYSGEYEYEQWQRANPVRVRALKELSERSARVEPAIELMHDIASMAAGGPEMYFGAASVAAAGPVKTWLGRIISKLGRLFLSRAARQEKILVGKLGAVLRQVEKNILGLEEAAQEIEVLRRAAVRGGVSEERAAAWAGRAINKAGEITSPRGPAGQVGTIDWTGRRIRPR